MQQLVARPHPESGDESNARGREELSNGIRRIQSPGSFPFNIFINDLAENEGVTLIRFSDDTQLRKTEICQMTQLGSKKISAAVSDGPGPTR